MPKRKKKPAEGDRVIVHCYWTDSDKEGVVDLLMSEQFSWIGDNGARYITRYDGAWKYAKAEEAS